MTKHQRQRKCVDFKTCKADTIEFRQDANKEGLVKMYVSGENLISIKGVKCIVRGQRHPQVNIISDISVQVMEQSLDDQFTRLEELLKERSSEFCTNNMDDVMMLRTLKNVDGKPCVLTRLRFVDSKEFNESIKGVGPGDEIASMNIALMGIKTDHQDSVFPVWRVMSIEIVTEVEAEAEAEAEAEVEAEAEAEEEEEEEVVDEEDAVDDESRNANLVKCFRKDILNEIEHRLDTLQINLCSTTKK